MPNRIFSTTMPLDDPSSVGAAAGTSTGSLPSPSRHTTSSTLRVRQTALHAQNISQRVHADWDLEMHAMRMTRGSLHEDPNMQKIQPYGREQ